MSVFYQVYRAQALEGILKKLCLVNLISKDVNLVFYLSVYDWFTLQTSDYDAIVGFRVDSTSLTTSFKKYNVMMI